MEVKMAAPRRVPMLVLNPDDDPAFGDLVRRRPGRWRDTPDRLQRRSRLHPTVVVHRRELSDEPFEIWYVYRDGRWTGTDRGRPTETWDRGTGEGVVRRSAR
jgi:hypothetical protein